MSSDIWIGVDPGGKGNFGVALLRSETAAMTCAVDNTDQALGWVIQEVDGEAPQAAGIDAPIWWSSGSSGLRDADRRLHARYPAAHILAVNSLWGSVLVQGVLVAHLLRDRFSSIGLTEAHPKAVLLALGRDFWEQKFRAIQSDVSLDDSEDNQRDALIAAFAAREGFRRAWPEDLFAKLQVSEQNPSSRWLAPVHYYWPERLPST